MFKFSGKRPSNLGSMDGKFTARKTWKPNWVSSQVASTDPHYVAPIKSAGDAGAVIAKVAEVVKGVPRAKIIKQESDYLYAEFSTALMGFTDDVEFIADGQQLQVRSSSRLGIRDFDVNRKRVEALRAKLA